jgi:hypothetical protein
MALTATIALAQTPISFNQKSTANVTISNSGGSPVNVVSLAPQVEPRRQTIVSLLPQGFAPQYVVPAGGSVVVPFDYICLTPQVAENGNLSQSVPTTYTVGCNIITSDGSSFAPTPATQTITPIQAN